MLISTVSATSLLAPSVAVTAATMAMNASVTAAAAVSPSSSPLILIAKDEDHHQRQQQQPHHHPQQPASALNIIPGGVTGSAPNSIAPAGVIVGGSDFVQQHHHHKSPPPPPSVILPMRTLSPPLHPSLTRAESGGGSSVFDSPPSPLGSGVAAGHPRDGQTGAGGSASLLGNRKYLLLEELEGSSLQRCLHIPTRQEFVCKVR